MRRDARNVSVRHRSRPAAAARRHRPADGHNFALLCRHGTRVTLVILPGMVKRARWPRSRSTPRKPHRRPLAHPRRRPAADVLLRLARRRPARAAAPLRPDASSCSTRAAHALSRRRPSGAGTCEADPQRTGRRSLFYRGRRYDWGDDAPPLTPLEDTIIYELHVRGFTCHPSRGVAHPGTFAGLVEKIPYLKWLGVTAVELLPVHEFDENDCPFVNPLTGEQLRNFWGYNTHRLRRPEGGLRRQRPTSTARSTSSARWSRRSTRPASRSSSTSSSTTPARATTAAGPTRFRGLDNELYYMLDDRRPLPELHRLRQHGQLQPPGRPRPAS